jgi:hypothetical protein
MTAISFQLQTSSPASCRTFKADKHRTAMMASMIQGAKFSFKATVLEQAASSNCHDLKIDTKRDRQRLCLASRQKQEGILFMESYILDTAWRL